jgi:hypothetical protein
MAPQESEVRPDERPERTPQVPNEEAPAARHATRHLGQIRRGLGHVMKDRVAENEAEGSIPKRKGGRVGDDDTHEPPAARLGEHWQREVHSHRANGPAVHSAAAHVVEQDLAGSAPDVEHGIGERFRQQLPDESAVQPRQMPGGGRGRVGVHFVLHVHGLGLGHSLGVEEIEHAERC